jgi:hypothetical protein
VNSREPGAHSLTVDPWALHGQRATVHDVELRHRRPDVSMPEQLLHSANVVAIFK